MKRSVLIACVIAALALPFFGCSSSSGGSDNPFKGTWRIVRENLTVEFDSSSYSITIPGYGKFSGGYSYAGEYPDFVAALTIQGEAQPARVNVHFNTEDQFRACSVSNPGDCSLFDRI